MPRARKVPRRYEQGARDSYHTEGSFKEFAKRQYFIALDNTMATIKERFDQADVSIYNSFSLLLRQAMKGNNLQLDSAVVDLYSDEFDFDQLKTQLSLLYNLLDGEKIDSVKQFAEWLKESSSRPFLGQVERLIKLLLTLPATNASSERTFSALKRVKSYLRNSMGQQRLNSCMLLHIYREIN